MGIEGVLEKGVLSRRRLMLISINDGRIWLQVGWDDFWLACCAVEMMQAGASAMILDRLASCFARPAPV